MSELLALLAETTEKVLRNLPTDGEAAERALKESGVLEVMRAEDRGGFGGNWEDAFIVLRAIGYHATPIDNLAGRIVVARPGAVNPGTKFRHLALARACQMAGAMQAALDLSVQYVRERQQFGKPLASFQAIQQQLAVAAEESSATTMAARAACRAEDRGPARFEIAAAKLRANIAVGAVTSVAHQVHGAMGFTKEYKLQRLTKALWQWRSDYGNDRYWSDELGKIVAKQGTDGFWPALVSPATIAPAGSG